MSWSCHPWKSICSLAGLAGLAGVAGEDQILNVHCMYCSWLGTLFVVLIMSTCVSSIFFLSNKQPRVERDPKTKVDDQHLGIPYLKKIPLCGYVCISNLSYSCPKPLHDIRQNQNASITFHIVHQWHACSFFISHFSISWHILYLSRRLLRIVEQINAANQQLFSEDGLPWTHHIITVMKNNIVPTAQFRSRYSTWLLSTSFYNKLHFWAYV